MSDPSVVSDAASRLDIDDLLMQPEIQESLVTMVKELPRIATFLTVMSKACDVTKEALSDGEFLDGLEQTIRDAAGGRPQGIYAAIQEARQRANQDCAQIGVFGLLRMLKDPTVQKNLRFLQALLSVLSERQGSSAACSR